MLSRSRLRWWLTAMVIWVGAALGGYGESPLRVTTTIFPLYDWTCQVAGDLAEVVQLVPPGANAHLYAPRPGDLVQLHRSDVFIYLHHVMEPWAQELASSTGAGRLRVVEAAADLTLQPLGGSRAETDATRLDPHVWLDPLLAAQMVRRIAAVLAEADPVHASEYTANADRYVSRLERLDEYIRRSLSGCRTRTVLYAGPFPFGYFARRYDLHFYRLYRGASGEAAIGAADLARLIEKVRTQRIKVIFHAELFDPKAARAIAAETGARLVPLHGLHNLTAEEKQRGVTYVELMERNVRRLKEALGCRGGTSR